MNLFQLTYLSKSELHPLGLHEELEIIQKTATENNRVKKISGILIYRNGYFLQRLEGNRKDIIYLAESIAADRRQSDFRILEQEAINERLFNDWTQLLLLSTKRETQQLDELFERLAQLHSRNRSIQIDIAKELACITRQLSHVAWLEY